MLNRNGRIDGFGDEWPRADTVGNLQVVKL